MLKMEEELAGNPTHQAIILREAGLDLTTYTRPIGIEDTGGYDATKSLFLTILKLTEYIGLIYKDRFNRPRPNQIDSRLRPFLPNPPHASYPSNHSFQSFAIADVFAEIAESERAVAEMYRSARSCAENREYAGLHYPSDTEAGRQLAKQCLPYLIEAMDEPMRRAQLEWY
jgi:membrane-associated phospholipid phosphatase